jgi:serralysin
MSGSSGTGVLSIARSDDPSLSTAENQNLSSVLFGAAWNARTITYSFPTTSDVYGTQATYGDPAPFNGFLPVTAQQKGEILRAFSLIGSYTGLSFSEINETVDTHATVRFANSFSPATAYAYYPGTYAQAGDVFFGRLGRNPVMGNSDSGQVLLHEIGHALGLKHGQEVFTYGAMNPDRLDIEFSLMNYPNYIGSTEGYQTASTSPQSFMMYDIAALQHMYGATFDRVGDSATYTWSATTGAAFIDGVSQGMPVDNHIFQTIWTGGAASTYDLSNFAQDQVDDMTPGGWMSFSTAQLAHLNAFAPTKAGGDIHARGNIYNALLADGDTRSLITNLASGAGSDIVTGNAAGNDIRAGAGNDKVSAGGGNDRVFGGAGNDTLAGDAGNDQLDGGAGMDMLAGGPGKDIFTYAAGYGADTILDFLKTEGDAIDLAALAGIASIADVLARGVQILADAVFDFGNGDSLTVKNVQIGSLAASDFVLPPVAPTQIIEEAGTTSLVQVGNGWFMPAIGAATGPQLMVHGTPVVAGQFGAWRPIGAEAAETGYVVVWKNGDADLYFVWNTDAKGDYLWTSMGAVPGSNHAIESRETLFRQDLSGDGKIGLGSEEPALALLY